MPTRQKASFVKSSDPSYYGDFPKILNQKLELIWFFKNSIYTSCKGYAALYTPSDKSLLIPKSWSAFPNFSLSKIYDATVILVALLK